ncbi:TonB-dependent Receptor Plug Domain [Granulicella rosea]|uniref:TonB-dependent Receptor Plug Domain n=1 Tax=Granulicella rosea TaxID=474952 RepID=A0A239JXP0_9BACT|nr:carboxypeptidase-like regulatory domain-containing protein [Granulicella rosea]SNT10238.1 TonB-dependent Receptor Plug Domain [Granulicella rosea]
MVVHLWAATGGSISGAVVDQSGAGITGATLTLVNNGQKTTYHAATNGQGLFSFPNLPVGHYDLTTAAPGFSTQRNRELSVDTDSALQLDIKLTMGSDAQTVDVEAETGSIHVETSSTHLGEVVSAAEMTALPLNGRSYTDLLAIQPGVAPISTLLPSSVIMAGVTGGIDPSGDANPGNLSINGQRESANGFMVNGIDVQEHMNGGASIIPNLDSIEEFRVLTNNFDPEYGNYDGGIVTVVSKTGNNHLHGSAFEFFRNTALDARGYFDPTRSAYNQNQFGGAIGGPVFKDKIFFFTDYQGTRTTQGISTGQVSVPTNAQRGGTFDDLTGFVSGPYLASLLTQELGYGVSSGEAYTQVFPHGNIPQSTWSAPGKTLLGYIPVSNIRDGEFSSSANSQTVRDDKGSARLDGNSRLGQLNGYYFVDDYRLDNPYPGSVAGASIPGFDALYIGRAQLLSLGLTNIIRSNTVNELHVGLLRNNNIIGQPKGGIGVSLASQGFAPSANGGIYVQAPQFEGVENVTFPSFVMGVPITNETQINNTYYVSDGLSRAIGSHTFKVGGQFHIDQVNEHPNATFNGTFNINGTETGDPYADLLLGTPSNFTQSSGQPFYLRNRYVGLYAQDSWRARNDLVVNIGLRWDRIMPWWEKYNQLQTYIAGQQSVLYPGAPPGFVVAGDPGVPRTLAPTTNKNFAPRIGLAYSPKFQNGLWSRIFGASGQSSIRASYGIFYTAIPGLTTGIMYAVPPFGYNYLSPGPPLLAQPFITAATGLNNGQRFPFPFPSHHISISNPDSNVNWDNFTPIAADPFFDHAARAPYTDNYMLSIQRQITSQTLLTVSYVGNQGHHIFTLASANPGNQGLCLSLPGCGPFGEDSPYTDGSGKTYQGTRAGQGPLYGENTADKSIANSNYNAMQTTLRYHAHGSEVSLSYTYAKSIDQGSNLGEQFDPLDARHTRAISAWDMKHAFIGSYQVALPVTTLFHRSNRLTADWSLSGTARFASGFPVTLYDNSDDSLLGTLGNGANNYLLDTPRYLGGPLKINTNGRTGRHAFDTAQFAYETRGQLGNAKRRMFYGPGIDNYDITFKKGLRLTEGASIDLRMEAFNVFNHAQFYGPASVDGQIEDPAFGAIGHAADPRLMQLAAKFNF